MFASNRKIRLSTLIGLVVLLGLVTLPLQAQRTSTQTIEGLVTDATGAVIPGATVTMTNVDTGITTTVNTNETGNYRFSYVPVGNYNVRCELDGFKTQSVSGVRVETTAQVRTNFTMEVGDVTETIEVAADAITLNTENSTVGSVIENRQIVELPLNGRNIVQLAVLVPGVQFGQRSGMNRGDSGYIPEGSYSVSANGVRELHQVVSLDGTDTADVRRSVTPFVPSIEAIEEFKLQTSSFSAETGFGGGAVTNITLKSGTNELHGTFYEFLRNNALDAEPYFLNFERAANERREVNQRIRNQFGFVMSGPIVKNKTFWMFAWDGRRERTKSVAESFYPHDSFRGGDFSELMTPTPRSGGRMRQPILIYDPFTGDPFPNNTIPSDRIHPGIRDNILPVVARADFRQPDPLDFTRRQGLVRPLTVNQYFTKVDHHFSDTDRIFGRLAVSKSDRVNPTLNPNFMSTRGENTYNVATQWIHTFNQNMINEFRFGFQKFNRGSFSPRTGDESFNMPALGIGPFHIIAGSGRQLDTDEHGYPNLSLYNVNDGREYNNPNNQQIGNHLSVIKGSHNLKMGGEVYRLTMHDGGANLGRGRVRWSNNEVGLNHASFLMGIPNTTETPEGVAITSPVAVRQGYYIQDDWKFSPRLTINMGFRFDYNGNIRGRGGFLRTVLFPDENHAPGTAVGNGGFTDPDTGRQIPTMGPPELGEGGAIKLFHQDVRFFMPRLGIAYRPTEKWVVRTAAGYFDNLMHWNNWSILNLNPPLAAATEFIQTMDPAQSITVSGIGGEPVTLRTQRFRDNNLAITLDDPFLDNVGALPSNLGDPVNTVALNPETKDGDMWKWSFDLQRDLGFNTQLTVGYVGHAMRHVGNSMRNWNSPAPSPDSQIQANRPFPRFFDPATPELGVQNLSTVRYLDTYQNAFHHGLQMELKKRYSSGFMFGVAYTFSKTHGDGEAGGNQGAQIQQPRLCRHCDRGRLRFDQTQYLVANFVWEMPGRNLPGALKHIIGGWQSNGIISLRTGFPYQIRARRQDLNVVEEHVRPDLVGQPAFAGQNRKLWFRPDAFQRVTCRIPERQDLCHVGDFGYNVLDSPGQRRVDFGLFKNFQITERFTLQFRSEFYNALNTPYFNQPSSSLGFSSVTQLTPDSSRQGEIRGTRQDMRILQFGLKLSF